MSLCHEKHLCERRFQSVRARRCGPWRTALLWGLVWLVGTQVALIGFLEWRRPEFFDPKYGCRMEALRTRQQIEPRRTLLAALGSSRVEQGFRPGVLEASTDGDNPLFYNLARGGSSPLMHLLTFRRLLADGVRPDILLVEIFPPVLVEEDGDVTVFKPTLRDWPVLRRYPLSAETYAFWLRDRALFWHRYRNGLLAWLAPSWLSPRARWGGRLWDYRGGEWRVIGDGVAPSERQRLTADARRRYIHALEHFQITAAADRALRELLELCGQQRIPVVLFLMPESREFRSWYGPEARRRLRDYLAELQHDFDVALLDARTWIGDDDFSDGHHLLQRGAVVFTRRFIAEILSLHEQEQHRQEAGVK